MKNILNLLVGLVVGGIVGWMVKPCYRPPEGYKIISQEVWDSINSITSQPPIVIRDTVWKYGVKVKTDTVWITTRDSAVQWWTDSLVNPNIRTWHSVAYSGKVYGGYWEFEPVTKIIRDSVTVYVPRLIEVERNQIVDKWYFYAGVYSYADFGVCLSAVRKDFLFSVGYSGKKYPLLLVGYHFSL